MARPGYEADRFRIVLLDRRQRRAPRVLTEDWDRSAGGDRAGRPTARRSTRPPTTSASSRSSRSTSRAATATALVDKGHERRRQRGRRRASCSRSDTLHGAGRALLRRAATAPTCARSPRSTPSASPPRAWATTSSSPSPARTARRSTASSMQAGRLRARRRSTRSRSSSTAARRARFGNHFHYRWNPQAYAGAGYAVVFIDFHGSTGYGQAFTDAIRGDWGGAPLRGPDEGPRRRAREVPLPRRPARRGARRLLRRLHDQLDRGPDRSLRAAWSTTTATSTSAWRTSTPRSCGSPSGSTAARPGTNPEGFEKHNPIDSRRRTGRRRCS